MAKTHFKKIYRGDFDPQNLLQLANTSALPIAKDQDIETQSRMTRGLVAYLQIVYYFANPAIQPELQQAFAHFHIYMAEYVEIYTLQSTRQWLYTYTSTRMHSGQDDPVGWKDQAADLGHYLIPHLKIGGVPLRSTPAPTATKSDHVCHNFNKGSYTLTFYKYQHVCSNYSQSSHPLTHCQKAASRSNSTPLAERVQRV